MNSLNETQLRELYGQPSGRAVHKDIGLLDKHAVHFISKSPFLTLSSYGKNGKLDASPRGGEPGFVKVINGQLLIPDFKGNNRIDSLTNNAQTNRVGLLFMIPGIDETLRVNGKAYISDSPELLKEFDSEQKSPITCILVEVEELFLHCAKAFMRSKLWASETHIDPKEFPSMGQMLKDQLKSMDPVESREDMIKRYQKDL